MNFNNSPAAMARLLEAYKAFTSRNAPAANDGSGQPLWGSGQPMYNNAPDANDGSGQPIWPGGQPMNPGAAGDSISARISPYEAAILRSLGGSGSLNPQTGQTHFAAAPGTPAAGTLPQPPQLGGYNLAPLMSNGPTANLFGNLNGQVPSWAISQYQLGMAPQFPNPRWQFPTGGAFNAPGMAANPVAAAIAQALARPQAANNPSGTGLPGTLQGRPR